MRKAYQIIAGLVGLVILQVFVLPGLARDMNPFFGGLHGFNALLILGAAVTASRAAAVTPEPAKVDA